MGSGIRYSAEFKAAAVREVRESDRSCRDIAMDLGINSETLRGWVHVAKVADMEDTEFEDRDAVRELRAAQRRIAELERQCEFLKKAAAFFAAEQNQKNGLR